MELLLARHHWSVDGMWDAMFSRIRASGYGAATGGQMRGGDA